MTNAIAKSGYSPAQIQTIKNTVAAGTTDNEFNMFMEACRNWGLDAFRKQIHCIIFSANNPKNRRVAIFPSRDGLRVMAARCADYRPADEKPQIDYDQNLKGPTNPLGIESATVKLYKQDSSGNWNAVVGIAYWDEFAPVVNEWAYDQEQGKKAPTGEKVLQDGTWHKMGRLMIAKCAEGQALRAGWPETFGGMPLAEELEREQAEESATSMLEEYQEQLRLERTGGPGLLMVFDDSMSLQKVPLGQVYDQCDEFIRKMDPAEVYNFQIRNEQSLRDFWVHDKAAALELKEKIETKLEGFDPLAEGRKEIA